MEMALHALVGFLWLMVTLPTPAAGADIYYIATATLVTNPTPPGPGTTGQVYTLGTVTFTQKAGENKVTLDGHLKLDQSVTFVNTSLGFHVHATSNFTNGCVSVGGHYNPENKTHGGPTDAIRHVGDLGNVEFKRDTLEMNVQISDTVITLVGPHTIIGRTLVLHTGTDDLGKGGNEGSLTTGNSGLRYACGSIVLASDFSPSSADSVLVSGSRVVMASLIAIFSIAMSRW